MSAWGSRSFENDSACDWLAELAGIRALRATLTRVVKAKAASDVDDASAAIAAAEVIAAARGHALKGAPDEVATWVARHGDKVTAADARLAVRAIARVQAGSELQELWAGHGKANPWTREVGKLLARLAAKPVARRTVARTKPAGPRRVVLPKMHLEPSPDGALRASVTSMKGISIVVIEAGDRGGCVCTARCAFEAMTIRWLDDATLEVTCAAKLLERCDSWRSGDRAIAIRYVAR